MLSFSVLGFVFSSPGVAGLDLCEGELEAVNDESGKGALCLLCSFSAAVDEIVRYANSSELGA